MKDYEALKEELKAKDKTIEDLNVFTIVCDHNID